MTTHKVQPKFARLSTEEASLAALVADIASADASIILEPGVTHTLTGDLTIPANITITPQMGVIATNGHNLTIEAPIADGPVGQLFDVSGGGAVVVRGNVRPEWWRGGSDPDDTDSLQLAIDAAEAQNDDITYLGLGGSVIIRGAEVLLQPGRVYTVTELTLARAGLAGVGGPGSAVIKHDAQGVNTNDCIIIKNATDNAVYGVSLRNVTIVGDGDLTSSSGALTANTTRYGVYIERGIRSVFLDNVTISQCQVGVQAPSCWTLSGSHLMIFNCNRCLYWTGAIAGGFQYSRFEGLYNATASASDHGVVVEYDAAVGVATEAIGFVGCAFQAAGKAGFYGNGINSIRFADCLFERCNKEDANWGYLNLDDTIPAAETAATLANVTFTTATDAATTSRAIYCNQTRTLNLVGVVIRDGSTAFANSIVTGSGVVAIIRVGGRDLSANGTSLHANTKYHYIEDVPTFHDKVSIYGTAPRLALTDTDGKEYALLSDGDDLVFRNETDSLDLVKIDGTLPVMQILGTAPRIRLVDSDGNDFEVIADGNSLLFRDSTAATIYGSVGSAGYNARALSISNARGLALNLVTAPSAPSAGGTIFVQDSGGKAQLAVRFPTGAIQVIATEP